MGIEPLILALWIGQAVAALVLAFAAASYRRWYAAAGTVLGLAIGSAPFVVVQGPSVWGPAILVVVTSSIALVVLYGAMARWKSLLAVLLIVAIPLLYRLFAYQSYPPSMSPILEVLALLGEIDFLLGPIVCALAFRAMLGWLDSRIVQRSA
jgi:hypothetical protein